MKTPEREWERERETDRDSGKKKKSEDKRGWSSHGYGV